MARDILPLYDCTRERAAAIRGVERCLSEFCMVWSTARLLDSHAESATKSDFVFHLKPVLEHTPARDRHEVCRRGGEGSGGGGGRAGQCCDGEYCKHYLNGVVGGCGGAVRCMLLLLKRYSCVTRNGRPGQGSNESCYFVVIDQTSIT